LLITDVLPFLDSGDSSVDRVIAGVTAEDHGEHDQTEVAPAFVVFLPGGSAH